MLLIIQMLHNLLLNIMVFNCTLVSILNRSRFTPITFWSAEVHVNFTLCDYELRLQEREQMRFQGRQCAKSRVLTRTSVPPRISAPPEAVAENGT
jgi:hypothetical protein